MAQAAVKQMKPAAGKCCRPGPVLTSTSMNPSGEQAKDVGKSGADTPMKRPAQSGEIAPAYIFVASPDCASYITGEILPIIGGYSGG